MYNIVDAIYQMVVSISSRKIHFSWTMMIICYALANNVDDHDNDDHDNDDHDDDGGGGFVVGLGNGNDEVVNVEDALIIRLGLRVNKGSQRRETQLPELQRSLSRWTGTMSVDHCHY